MARRGIANYEPAQPHDFNIFWSEILRSSDDGINGIKQAYDLPPKSQFHFSEVTTTNRELLKHPREFALAAPTRELRAALAEPSGCFGRAGRSSWHYNVNRPLGRKVKIHQIPSAKFDGGELPHLGFSATTSDRGRLGGSAHLTLTPRLSARPKTESGVPSRRSSPWNSTEGSRTQNHATGEFEAIFNKTKLSSWSEFAPTIQHPRLW